MLPDPTPLDEVIATEALDQRLPRVRNLPAEDRALAEMKRVLAGSPRGVLQKLVEVALDLCDAQSAGITLLEEADGRRFFRWHAVTGQWSHLLWNTLPRDFSPCGTVLDRREALLMIDPERYFTPLLQIPPRAAEVLLVPFAVRGETVGTVWVITHDSGRQFDREDRRIVSELTEFAAAAYERLQSFKADDILELSRLHQVQGSKPPEPDRAS
jgi:two-component system CheB/CheR fusion protein